jgi:cyclic pyranopterin phosphate synthase
VGEDSRPSMVDVSGKEATLRVATARTTMFVPDAVMALFSEGEIQSAKGPVFQTAVVAGTMAVKRTSDLIPMCHPLPIEGCEISIDVDDSRDIIIDCTVRVHHKTGVEMEALVGASIAALTVYDMCKSVSHDIRIGETRLLRKSGGKRDFDVSSL